MLLQDADTDKANSSKTAWILSALSVILTFYRMVTSKRNHVDYIVGNVLGYENIDWFVSNCKCIKYEYVVSISLLMTPFTCQYAIDLLKSCQYQTSYLGSFTDWIPGI